MASRGFRASGADMSPASDPPRNGEGHGIPSTRISYCVAPTFPILVLSGLATPGVYHVSALWALDHPSAERAAVRRNPGHHSTGALPVSYTHLRAHETPEHLVCRLLLE